MVWRLWRRPSGLAGRGLVMVLGAGLILGSVSFFVADLLVTRRAGKGRKRSEEKEEDEAVAGLLAFVLSRLE